MAEISDLSFRDRLWYRRYRFRKVDPLPWSPLPVPLPEARVAVVTSAGLHLPEDPPFEKLKGGDHSYRTIPRGTDLAALRCTHPSRAWDRKGVEADRNVALPLERLEELEAAGEIGSVAPRHFSFQGSITAPLRLQRHSAPEVARAMREDGVDLVLLTPV